MTDYSVLLVFLSTCLFVSATPGMCMTLALTMGLSIGLKRTFWMMWGELIGVGIVSVASVVGVATLMLQYPQVFSVLKYVGGAYLAYLGVQMWLSRGKMAIPEKMEDSRVASPTELATQGFVTAISNPKGWAFMVSLLPPFISTDAPMAPQLATLVSILLIVEFFCLVLYASGGRTLRHFLLQGDNVRLLNRIAGTLMIGVGAWLAFF
ncbi:LysE family translocator [Hahella sp. CR1]|uniref:LysE family translocator n=1 Tax=Hahella sp. CR1 TaxID=2992807 RepID=UPI002441E5E6|nr:LysE family translocator [Hahella sp. CR1]MDG9671894.1 LysE family translocator [Hahella sp. CR1]